tara:strand:+ start:1837 stop:2106 length:270 start_codon:yes stop_codon:yes gene_type:complete
MIVRFNSRNKGGIGTPHFSYLHGSVHASTRFTNASIAAAPSTTIQNPSGMSLPKTTGTSSTRLLMIINIPKKIAVKSMINSRIIVDFGG